MRMPINRINLLILFVIIISLTISMIITNNCLAGATKPLFIEAWSFCYIRTPIAPVFDKPGGNCIGQIYQGTIVPIGAEHGDHLLISVDGWCQTEFLMPIESDDLPNDRILVESYNLMDVPTCFSKEQGPEVGINLGHISAGTRLICGDTECQSTMVTLFGYVPIASITQFPPEIVIPNDFKAIRFDSDSDSVYFIGLIRNPHPDMELGSYHCYYNLVAEDNTGNNLFEHSFSIGSRSQASDNPEWLRIQQSIPFHQNASTLHLTRPAQGIKCQYK